VDSEFNLFSPEKKNSAPQCVAGDINPLAFAVYFQRTESTFGRSATQRNGDFPMFRKLLQLYPGDGNDAYDKTRNLLLLRDLIPKVNPKYKRYLEA
jgi:hypothetical protein